MILVVKLGFETQPTVRRLTLKKRYPRRVKSQSAARPIFVASTRKVSEPPDPCAINTEAHNLAE